MAISSVHRGPDPYTLLATTLGSTAFSTKLSEVTGGMGSLTVAGSSAHPKEVVSRVATTSKVATKVFIPTKEEYAKASDTTVTPAEKRMFDEFVEDKGYRPPVAPTPYPLEFYEEAETGAEKCFSSIHAADPRLQYIAYSVTNAVKEAFDESLRKPITDASIDCNNKIDSLALTPKEVCFHHFPKTYVLDDALKSRFMEDEDQLVIFISAEKLQKIVDKILTKESRLEPKASKERPEGCIPFNLRNEVCYRLFNVMKKYYKPEIDCIDWLAEKNKIKPYSYSVPFLEGMMWNALEKLLEHRPNRFDCRAYRSFLPIMSSKDPFAYKSNVNELNEIFSHKRPLDESKFLFFLW
jgi:hypothetical protein